MSRVQEFVGRGAQGETGKPAALDATAPGKVPTQQRRTEEGPRNRCLPPVDTEG